ncbi:hypothetical protein [Methylobacterium sp. JK268]
MDAVLKYPMMQQVFAWVGYLVVCGFIGHAIGKLLYSLAAEARAKDKRIELMSVATAVLALLVSGAALAYTIRQVDSLTDRVAALEKLLPANSPKPN